MQRGVCIPASSLALKASVNLRPTLFTVHVCCAVLRRSGQRGTTPPWSSTARWGRAAPPQAQSSGACWPCTDTAALIQCCPAQQQGAPLEARLEAVPLGSLLLLLARLVVLLVVLALLAAGPAQALRPSLLAVGRGRGHLGRAQQRQQQ